MLGSLEERVEDIGMKGRRLENVVPVESDGTRNTFLKRKCISHCRQFNPL